MVLSRLKAFVSGPLGQAQANPAALYQFMRRRLRCELHYALPVAMQASSSSVRSSAFRLGVRSSSCICFGQNSSHDLQIFVRPIVSDFLDHFDAIDVEVFG